MSKQDLILEVTRNKSLTPEEKKTKIQNIMLGDYEIVIPECTHYKKSCGNFHFTCCDKYYDCCRCHNQANICNKSIEIDSIKCLKCNENQIPSETCINCNVKFSRSYCLICNIWSEKNIFHCEKCGLCRVGEQDKYFHCDNCQACFKKTTTTNGNDVDSSDILQLSNQHICLNGVSYSKTTQCLLCLENASTSQFILTLLPKCHHFAHAECIQLALKNNNYKCPLCRKSMIDMQYNWFVLDTEILLHPLPEELNKKVDILCYDCENKTENIDWHFIGIKCGNCGSYNTSKI